MKDLPVAGTLNAGVRVIGLLVSIAGWGLVCVGVLVAIGVVFRDGLEIELILIGAMLSLGIVLVGVLLILMKSWVIERFSSGYQKNLDALQETVDVKLDKVRAERAVKLQLKLDNISARDKFLASVSKGRTEPIATFVGGGAGWEQLVKKELFLTTDEVNIYLTDMASYEETAIPIAGLSDVHIDGPGRVTSGGGFSGGGFGVEGFLKGAAAAMVLNLLTTRTKTQSIIYLQFSDSELILFNSLFEPDVLRIKLSRLFLRKSFDRTQSEGVSPSVADQISDLKKLVDTKILTEDEFAAAKKKILS
jgi:hypothetical protein